MHKNCIHTIINNYECLLLPLSKSTPESLTLGADLSDVHWELNCKLKVSLDSTDNKMILDAIILNEDDVDDYDEKEWKLPYSTPLNYK